MVSIKDASAHYSPLEYIILRFNGLDQRLQRELELMAMVMEGLQGSENRVRYDIIGHSGENPHIPFVKRDLPPNNEKKRLQVLEVHNSHFFENFNIYLFKFTVLALI